MKTNASMKSGRSASRECLAPAVEKNIDGVCDRFEAAWKGAERPQIEEYVARPAEPEYSALLHELLRIDIPYRKRHGESPRPAEYECRFPRHTATIGRAFADMERSNIDRHDSATPFSQAAQPAAEEPPHPSAEPLPKKLAATRCSS